ncbi:MAG: hydroxymethylglutaryl-CoA reductase (NADPH) [Methanomassiliicoccales archaeon]|nr:MAG: hydroxymethylglutaryl-CoA reductase (NADPH) [Methanomassiliicoccales archaeon]
MTGGLKNRGRTKADVDERRSSLEEATGTKLEHIGSYSFDPILAQKNIENMIGCVQVPVGFVGPLAIDGDHAKGEFYVPLATTEGALVASVNRGCSAITASGGANVIIIKDEMTRAPVFRTEGVKDCRRVADWVASNFERIRSEAEGTTSHGKLVKVRSFASGRNLYLRFSYNTGDAMGMNMATIATEAAARLIERETGAVLVSVSGNMCTDKKPAAINSIDGRGKIVLADVKVPRSVVEDKLKTTVPRAVEACYRKNNIGSAMAMSYGHNAHMANILAAVYIACGQDPAQVVEGSMGMTTCEDVDGDLYISVRLPCIEVGSIGGGTRLPCQNEALSIIGCAGPGNAKKLAEVIGATVLAGELSTIAAQAAGELGKAHRSLGR